jgi:probable HAF family extracellular repeat protein
MIPLGDLPGGEFQSQADAVSADGLTVVGVSNSDLGSEAFYWTEADTMTGLGVLSEGPSYARAASGDGSVIVGISEPSSEAFVWTEVSGMKSLGRGSAWGVSDDGSIVVGPMPDEVTGDSRAFRWTEATGMVDLGDLPGGDVRASATAISGDGRVIVGYSSSILSPWQTFRWTETGGMEAIGAFGAYSAFDVSFDGTRIVGELYNGSTDVAYMWDAVQGVRTIQDILVNEYGLDLGGWELTQANGISADGHTIVGLGRNPSGSWEAWIAILPQPVPALQPIGVLGLASLLLALGLVGLAAGRRCTLTRSLLATSRYTW